MPIAPVNGIEICYDSFEPTHAERTLVLIRGLGSQMTRWEPDFCQMFVERGFRVIRFDNRDVGLSTKFTDAGAPDLGSGDPPPYALDDMADDVVGLLDHLGIEQAHVAGMSMGGMIAQLVAINHPARVLSLASIMSSPGGEGEPPKPEAWAIFTRPRPKDRAEAIEQALESRRVIGSPGFDFDDVAERRSAEEAYDRCYHPDGQLRQIAAIGSAPSRVEALGRLAVPAVVIHGKEDPLVRMSNGKRTAEAIPDAKLVLIDGMGHDIPKGAWPEIVDAIATNAERGSA